MDELKKVIQDFKNSGITLNTLLKVVKEVYKKIA